MIFEDFHYGNNHRRRRMTLEESNRRLYKRMWKDDARMRVLDFQILVAAERQNVSSLFIIIMQPRTCFILVAFFSMLCSPLYKSHVTKTKQKRANDWPNQEPNFCTSLAFFLWVEREFHWYKIPKSKTYVTDANKIPNQVAFFFPVIIFFQFINNIIYLYITHSIPKWILY